MFSSKDMGQSPTDISSNIPVVSPCPMQEECVKLLREFQETFDPELPVERVDVEPLRIVFQDGFTEQPLNVFCQYMPAVQAGMETEVAVQLVAIWPLWQWLRSLITSRVIGLQ